MCKGVCCIYYDNSSRIAVLCLLFCGEWERKEMYKCKRWGWWTSVALNHKLNWPHHGESRGKGTVYKVAQLVEWTRNTTAEQLQWAPGSRRLSSDCVFFRLLYLYTINRALVKTAATTEIVVNLMGQGTPVLRQGTPVLRCLSKRSGQIIGSKSRQLR